MPTPGGTIRTLSKLWALHLRKAKRSALRSASIRAFSAAAAAQETTSAATEWSTTRVQGMRGLTSSGSPPAAWAASRMAAKSTKTGTPVKSWKRTRAGMNSISGPAAPARPASTIEAAIARARSSSATQRRTFSTRTWSDTGRRSAPGMSRTA